MAPQANLVTGIEHDRPFDPSPIDEGSVRRRRSSIRIRSPSRNRRAWREEIMGRSITWSQPGMRPMTISAPRNEIVRAGSRSMSDSSGPAERAWLPR